MEDVRESMNALRRCMEILEKITNDEIAVGDYQKIQHEIDEIQKNIDRLKNKLRR